MKKPRPFTKGSKARRIQSLVSEIHLWCISQTLTATPAKQKVPSEVGKFDRPTILDPKDFIQVAQMGYNADSGFTSEPGSGRGRLLGNLPQKPRSPGWERYRRP